jgi:hypothetical protein
LVLKIVFVLTMFVQIIGESTRAEVK